MSPSGTLEQTCVDKPVRRRIDEPADSQLAMGNTRRRVRTRR